MQNIVLFIEPTTELCHLPSKIGHLFINRFAIAEEEKSEILKIFELSDKISDLVQNNGNDLIIMRYGTQTTRILGWRVFFDK